MISVKNPARSRPLSRNVKRLMKMARESPPNPSVEKIEREFSERDLAYCDMQGSIFMAAVDRGIAISEFAPVFMNSQLAGVIDYSFSCAGGMEEDDISNYLRMPVLLKSPSIIVDTVMWLNDIVSGVESGENPNLAIVKALNEEDAGGTEPLPRASPFPAGAEVDVEKLADDYEYAYWLGYIYRCECHMHDESSRMVYGAFSEEFMRDFYGKLSFDEDAVLSECAPEICRRLDALLVGKLWKKNSVKKPDRPVHDVHSGEESVQQ